MKGQLLVAFICISFITSGLIDYYYNEGDEVKITVGAMNSVETQIPYNYHYLSICLDNFTLLSVDDNLGEIITGDRNFYSNYKININLNQYGKVLCSKKFTDEDILVFSWLIERYYTINWYLDKLPAGYNVTDPQNGRSGIHYVGGIPLAYKNTYDEKGDIYLYNHYTFKVFLNENSKNKYEIVGFNILPLSIVSINGTQGCADNVKDLDGNFVKDKQKLQHGEIFFTYDVIFEHSNIKYSSRWDHYRHLSSDIHWLGLIISNLVVMFFSIVVIHIFCRALKRDIDIYNIQVTSDDFIDEFGWKQVCNDVFRKPKNGMLLSSLTGTGVQLFAMVFYSLTFTVLGFLQPESRGSLLTLMILMFVFMGVISGYISARVYKTVQGKDWLLTALLTASLYPGIVFLVFFVANIMLAIEKSSASIKITDMISLIVLWLCCSSPLVLIGAFLGIKSKPFKTPCKVNPVPGSVPSKQWYLRTKYVIWVTGIIPFAVVFIELVYILASMWRHQIYFLAGFLYITLVILIIASSEITVIMTYFYLCKGDYNWWWKSFFISASPSLYVAVYSIYYFFNLNIQRFTTIFIYFGSMTLITSIIFLICGSMGMLLTFLFLKNIYSMIKID